MFIDLILFVFVLAILLLGIWLGASYGGVKKIARRLLDWAKAKIGDGS